MKECDGCVVQIFAFFMEIVVDLWEDLSYVS